MLTSKAVMVAVAAVLGWCSQLCVSGVCLPM